MKKWFVVGLAMILAIGSGVPVTALSMGKNPHKYNDIFATYANVSLVIFPYEVVENPHSPKSIPLPNELSMNGLEKIFVEGIKRNFQTGNVLLAKTSDHIDSSELTVVIIPIYIKGTHESRVKIYAYFCRPYIAGTEKCYAGYGLQRQSAMIEPTVSISNSRSVTFREGSIMLRKNIEDFQSLVRIQPVMPVSTDGFGKITGFNQD